MTVIAHSHAQHSLNASQTPFSTRAAQAFVTRMKTFLETHQRHQDLIGLSHANDKVLSDVKLKRQDVIRVLGSEYHAPSNVRLTNMELGRS